MLIATATMRFEFAAERMKSWMESCGVECVDTVWDNSTSNDGVVAAYHGIEMASANRDNIPILSIIAYIHDDVIIYEQDWGVRVLREFDDPKVAICGFGGALGLGVRDIYKVPYRIEQLARQDYYSNARDWEIHGKRETGSRDVAVVDGFFMAIRRTFLDEVGGWSQIKTRFHCYDTAMCLLAHRHGWKVRMVGVDCLHEGGGSSISPAYIAGCEKRGTTPEREHAEPHVWQYEEFRDVLPLRVK